MPVPDPHPINEAIISSTAASVATGVNGFIRAPFTGRVTKVATMIGTAVAAGDATCTTSIGATAITGGVITITQSGSAAGDEDSASPNAANACNEGDSIKFAFTGSGTGGGVVGIYATVRRGG